MPHKGFLQQFIRYTSVNHWYQTIIIIMFVYLTNLTKNMITTILQCDQQTDGEKFCDSTDKC